jgi:hypothetical protein
MMSIRRSAAVLACASLAIVASHTLGLSAASSKPPAKPGLAYGGHTAQGAQVWVRLRPDRRTIASLHLDWRASAAQCTDGRPLVMPEDLGADNGFPAIKLHGGRFAQTVPERAFSGDGSGPERFTIAGTVTDAAVRGTFSGQVTIDVQAGGQYVCTLPRTSFHAVN